MMEVMRISPKIQRAVMSGKLTDKSEYIFEGIETLENQVSSHENHTCFFLLFQM